MKKLLLCSFVASLFVLPALAAPPAPLVVIEQRTNVVQVVRPLTLSAAQMDGIIALCKSAGISANVPITTTNLQSVFVTRRPGTNGPLFQVNLSVK